MIISLEFILMQQFKIFWIEMMFFLSAGNTRCKATSRDPGPEGDGSPPWPQVGPNFKRRIADDSRSKTTNAATTAAATTASSTAAAAAATTTASLTSAGHKPQDGRDHVRCRVQQPRVERKLRDHAAGSCHAAAAATVYEHD